MTLLASGLLIFLGIHLTSVVGVRDASVQRLGEGPWKGLYSLISAAGLAAIVVGYGQARTEGAPMLYVPPTGLRHAALAVMIPVFPLLFAAYLPGRIQRWSGGHPMLLAVILWSIAHLMSNGMLPDVLLFGGFGLWAVVVRVSFLWREPRPVGASTERGLHDVVALVGGVAIYTLTLLYLHTWLIGVRPLPS